MQERVARPDSPFMAGLAAKLPGYDIVSRYAPNLVYTGALDMPAFAPGRRYATGVTARLCLKMNSWPCWTYVMSLI